MSFPDAFPDSLGRKLRTPPRRCIADVAADVALSEGAPLVAAVRTLSQKASTESLAGTREGVPARLERTSDTARWARFRT